MSEATTAPHRHTRTLAVVGAGTMGSGIALKMATEGFSVLLADVDLAKAERGLELASGTLNEAVDRGVFTAARAAAIRERIRTTERLTELAPCELVVEAVFEDFDVKRQLFAALEAVCASDAILATNTSSFSVTDLAAGLTRPERIVGLHYFYHPAKNRLVEVIPGRATGATAFEGAWALQEAMGKTPIRSQDSHGFIVNRFFAPWLIEAIRIVSEGVASISSVEAAAKEAFGIGMGPFELMNVTGLPIALHTAETLQRAFGAMYGPPSLLAEQIRRQALWPLDGEVDPTVFETVTDRLAGITFLVAASLVDEQVGSIDDIDLGARVGLRWRRGPFELMNRFGVKRAVALAADTAARWNLPLPRTLADAARRGEPFTFRFVTSNVDAGIATLTINRPDSLNALNEQVFEQLADRFHTAATDPEVRGIVITGAGKAFMAGADIRFFIKNIEAGMLDRTVAFTRRVQGLFTDIARCPKPVVARVSGLARGGGVELALACHWIVATPDASFAFPETGIGIFPGLGGMPRTTRRVGVGLCKWLVFTGQTLTATRAQEIGLIDRVVVRENLGEAVRQAIAAGPVHHRDPVVPTEEYRGIAAAFDRPLAEVQGVGDKAPIALSIADDLIGRGAELSVDSAVALELERLEEVFSTSDAYEGLTSIGRRAPVFSGR